MWYAVWVSTGQKEQVDLIGKVVYVDQHSRQAVLEIEFFGRVVKMKVGLEVVRKVEE